ncbi:hypothetical protein RJ639_023967 [Escallonia herrerae]|uniref:Retrotransposon gag domain-containing protein n=1 Tax=Escallonia herrerae TaxID=1293975 RepID=A0AA88UZZ9_9ASTE|nr:hypothetical protein RJ639_023967 [Escallonia herrerae]
MDVSVSNVLIDTYVKCGRVRTGRELFDQIVVKNVISWTTMIAGYMQNSFDREAMKLFAEMSRLGWKLDGFACTSVLTSCGSLEAVEQGRQVHSYAINANLASDEFVNNSLIDMYSKCNALTDARRAFDVTTNHSVISCNTMIEGYSRQGKLYEALHLFHEMRLRLGPPSLLTFVSLLVRKCSFVQFFDLARQLGEIIVQVLGCELTPLFNNPVFMALGCIRYLMMQVGGGGSGRRGINEDQVTAANINERLIQLTIPKIRAEITLPEVDHATVAILQSKTVPTPLPHRAPELRPLEDLSTGRGRLNLVPKNGTPGRWSLDIILQNDLVQGMNLDIRCRRPSRRQSYLPIFECLNVTSTTGLGIQENMFTSFEHVYQFQTNMLLLQVSDAVMCRAFPTTLRKAAHTWFKSLQPRSIYSFGQLSDLFQKHFVSSRSRRKNSASLLNIVQEKNESLACFLGRFNAATLEIDNLDESVKYTAFLRSLRPTSKFAFSVNKSPPGNMKALLEKANKYIQAEEYLETHKGRRGEGNEEQKKRSQELTPPQEGKPTKHSKYNERRPKEPFAWENLTPSMQNHHRFFTRSRRIRLSSGRTS